MTFAMTLLRLTTVFVLALPVVGQVQVTVPGNRHIALAGLPDGTTMNRSFMGIDTTPANSPILVNISLQPGRALQFSASGSVRLYTGVTVGPQGDSNFDLDSFDFAKIASLRAPAGALIGVFLPSPAPSDDIPPDLEFSGGAQEMEVLRPTLQQPFLIGDGKASTGGTRTIVIPPGAARLYLGVCTPIASANTGAFQVNINTVAVPDLLANPIRVYAATQIGLAGRDPAHIYFRFMHGEDIASLNAPAEVRIPLSAGERLRFSAIGAIKIRGTGDPDGPAGNPGVVQITGGGTGFSPLQCPEGGLVGIFTRDSANDGEPLRDIDYSPSSWDTPLAQPAIQQAFFIGNGLTSKGEQRVVVVPEGARRLFLSVCGVINATNTGSFIVGVSPDSPNTPQLDPSGIMNAAGFGPPPVAPGSLVSLFGRNLNAKSVWFNLSPAQVAFSSDSQLNVIVPPGATGSVAAFAGDGNGVSLLVPVAIEANHPGIFMIDDQTPAVYFDDLATPVSLSNPADPGDMLSVYSTGLGPDPAPVSVLIGSMSLTPLAVASAQTLAGVQIIRFVVPTGLGSGDVPLQIRAGANVSNRVSIRLR